MTHYDTLEVTPTSSEAVIKAAPLYQKASQQNNLEGVFKLGAMHDFGIAIEKNEKIGAELLKDAMNKCYKPDDKFLIFIGVEK